VGLNLPDNLSGRGLMSTIYDTIIIGAGQAGLATGYHLQRAGLRFLILEAGDEPGGSWPHFYDSLSLNSTARYSSLPGLPFPGQPDRYPRRDEAVTYLRSYAAHFALPIVTRARVVKVERLGRFFRVITADKGCYRARTIVAATGFFDQPNMPSLPGQAQYRGQVLHAANYRRPEPFRQQRVVVVGGGNAAVQIGVELAQVAQVTLATRHPIRYLPQRVLGRDIHFWLNLSGLDRSHWLDGQSMPVFDTGTYRTAIAASQPDRRPMFERFTTDGLIWSDGRHEKVDVVIFATGYRPHLAYLAELGLLDETGRVRQRRGASTTVPGLYSVCLPRQRNAASATLRGVGADAKLVVNQLRRYCEVQRRTHERRAADATLKRRTRVWVSRGHELIGLIGLMTLALRQQIATQRLATPRLVGEAMVRSLRVSAGFLGFGHASALYAPNLMRS
jgi:putative flavoprotein involved in K+ transport